MPKIIGIDLGTTNSEAAYIEAGRPIIVPSAEGNVFGGKNFPSVVAFTKDGELLVGDTAKRQAVTNPERTILRIKRKMGTDYKVTIDDKNYTPEQISAFILQKIKADAENHLGDTINEAVITVPAYFDDNQRNATKAAGEVAGLKVRRIINEPTAAALAYGLDREDDEGIVAVYDLGGGTFDITIMEMGGGVFEVKSTNGDTHLGGSDMDDAIINHLAKVFKDKSGIDATRDRGSLQRLRDAAERAKMELTSMNETTINIPYLGANDEGPQHLEMKINRAKLEELVRPIVERTRGPVEQAIKDAKIDRNEIKHVLLVGGPTRMPIVQTFAQEVFGQKPKRGVDPMQCVAMGAAIQAGVLSGDVEKEIVLLDVTPLTLGLETLGNVKTPLIERNTTIPTKKTQAFSTAADNQTTVEIHILQGERPMASDNRSLGRFRLDGIPPAPRGVPQIEVTYDIDANGILHVTAKDKATGKENKITVEGSTKLSTDEIEKMRRDAEEHKAEDENRKAKAEARNQADQAVIAAEKFINETSDKLAEDDKTTLQAAIDKAKAALEGDEVDAISNAAKALSKTMEPIVVKLYQQAAPPEGGTGSGADTSGEEWTGKPAGEDPDVVDADFKVKDDGGNGNGKETSEKHEESKTRDE